ncbi:MAG: acyltransferase [Bacteroidales bacterium]|nr:acyltransferase [Bacteroidales bacterium]
MNFDSIRCYNTEEMPVALERLSNEPQFMNLFKMLSPQSSTDELKKLLINYDNIYDFQKFIVNRFVKMIEKNTTEGVELTGLENIDKNRAVLYISNHRDIVLDAAFLCSQLVDNGVDTVEIGIGDNLLIYPWIEDFVRVNKSFIVRRSPGAKQMLETLQLLSAYIAHTIRDKNQSVWIAQREGRAKDADDRTQESLLKMFNMGGSSGGVVENLAALHICPLTISYEYDPCDYLKAKEFQQKRDNPGHLKSPEDDLLNMKTGLMGYKGRVVYKISPEISSELFDLQEKYPARNELFKAIAQLIDRKIHGNYTIYKVNMIAYDMLHTTERFHQSYSLREKIDFEKYMDKQIEKIDLEEKDMDFLKTKILEMYANPLKNKINAGVS